MKGEVPAKGTSPFFLIIIKFGTFFTHFEMILLYPEPYLSYFWCRIKRNRTNIMKITIRYNQVHLYRPLTLRLYLFSEQSAGTGRNDKYSRCQCDGNGLGPAKHHGSCPAGGGLADQRLSRKQICQERTARMDRRSTLYGDVRLGGTEWRQYLL